MDNKNILGAVLVLAVIGLIGFGYYQYGNSGDHNLFKGNGQNILNLNGNQDDATTGQNIPEVTADDHVQGDLATAKVVVVEYSDLECPFCKRFHQTMNQVMQEYQGQVAWVYRHFPLESLHSKAKHEAVAAECAATLGGNDKFWQYIDRVFEITPSNDGLDPAQLPKIAADLKLDQKAFTDCLTKNDTTKIEAQMAEAEAAGAQGTPFPVIVAADGSKTALAGALPFDQLKQILDADLAKAK